MKHVYSFLLALLISSLGFGQTLVSETLRTGSLPSGWSQTDVTFSTSANGYANFTSISAVLTTPIFDASGNATVDVSLAVAKFGSGGDGPITVEYSLDGGSNWITLGNTATPTSSTYLTSHNPLTITSTSSNMRIRFNRASSSSGKRVRDVVITGIGSAGPGITLSPVLGNTTEAGGTATFTVVLNEQPITDVVIDISSEDTGEVTISPTTRTFTNGNWDTSQLVIATGVDDGLTDGDIDVTVNVVVDDDNSDNAYDGLSESTTVTNEDDEVPPAGWQITTVDTNFNIDFDSTEAEVNNGQFDGSGFSPSPSTGQLDSDAWATTGMSDGVSNFGDTNTSEDFARSASTGGVGPAGFYAFETSTGNYSLGFQPTESEFTPGTVTLKTQNQTGTTITTVYLSYLIYVLNNDDRSNSLNLSYSTDDISYTDVSSLDFTSQATSDGSPTWLDTARLTSLTGLNIPNEGFFYLRWSSDDVSGGGSRDEFAIDDILVNFNPTVYVYNESWTPSDPNTNATPANNIEVQSGSASVTSDLNVYKVDISSGASLTVNTGESLTIGGDLTNSGSLTLNSTSSSYSSLIINGTSTGEITYNRWTAEVGPTGTNDLIASPISDEQFNEFAIANVGDLATSGSTAAFAPFNPGSGNYENKDTSETDLILPGKGYRAGTLAPGGETLAFTGEPNTGDLSTIALTDGAGSFWNLMGNPYSSYLDIGDFLTENVATTNIRSAFYGVYGYDADNSNGSVWTIWDLNVDQNLLIAPGQGFFVAAPSGGGNGIDFTADMQRTGTSDDFISGRNTNSNSNFAQAIINLSTSSTTFETNIFFRDTNTRGLDPGFDTGAFNQSDNGIYTQLVEDNAGVNLVNQSLPFNDLTDIAVPTVVNLDPSTQITFSLNSGSDLPIGINVYLEDNVENTSTLLNTSDYIITPSAVLSGSGRFFLRFTDNALSTGENKVDDYKIFAAYSGDSVTIIGEFNTDTKVLIFDLQGREVLRNYLKTNTTTQSIKTVQLNTGIYIVKVKNDEFSFTQKVIIR